jgi:uncharacterized protein YdeI (YjbR/CyaY-like superfamily)
MPPPEELVVADARAWGRWLAKHASSHTGVWLVLSKKGAAGPTSLTYDQALEEAICHGWVDGQLQPGDGSTFRRRFSPRRPTSKWSKRNVEIAERLIAAGRMQSGGQAAVDRAKATGAWDAAYAGPRTIEVPDDLAAALDANPAAKASFDGLDRANRYAVLYRITTVKRPETRARKIEEFVAMLAHGDTIHPRPPGGARRRPQQR